MKSENRMLVETLIRKGVQIENPEGVQVDRNVDPLRISGEGVVIHTGCKIFGRSTLILQGTELGKEGPVTIENCQLGPNVQLKSGYFKDAVFLEKAGAGYGSRIREGTILEEEASVSHAVDLKQTILFPFVTLGSLINFCDCLMAGGTSRRDHSEVGSSFIHFNFTPNQDKATPSLIGDVSRGVMLNQRSIFLGGQGGIVGPCRLEFGTVSAAGTICRKDQLKPDRLIYERGGPGGNIPHYPGMYRSVKRIVHNNLIYIANLMALMQWYRHVRCRFVSNAFPEALLNGLKEKLQMNIDERINRLEVFSRKMPDSLRIYQETLKEDASSMLILQKKEIHDNWTDLKEALNTLLDYAGDERLRDRFLERITSGIQSADKDYLAVIKGLNPQESEIGTHWLQGIVDHVVGRALKIIPSFGGTKQI
ncbi:MAG: protein GlmU [Desulfobacterales bacterium]|nr:protein GlmU [Desulfobacterales bacterium]